MAKKKTAKKKSTKKKVTKKGSTKKAPSSVPSSKHTAIRQWMGRVQGKKKHKVVAFGDEAPNTYMLRRPSGIMQLDIDTGGGAPAGGCIQLTGPDNSGKTYLLYLFCAMHQRIYGGDSAIAIGQSEGGFDYLAARRAGFIVRVPEETIEEMQAVRKQRRLPLLTKEEIADLRRQVGEFVLIQGVTGEELLQTIIDAVASTHFGIVGIDSISMLQPEQEAGKDMDDAHNARAHAAMMTNFWKKYSPLTNTLDGRNFTTLISISQVRARQNIPAKFAQFARKWEGGGSRAQKHGKLIDIVVTSGEKLKRQIQGQKYVIGKMMKWELEKGKAGTHDNISGEAPFIYPNFGTFGVNLTDSIVVTGMQRGILAEGRHGEVLLRQVDDEGNFSWIEIAQSMSILPSLFKVDFDFEMQVRNAILEDANIHCLYR